MKILFPLIASFVGVVTSAQSLSMMSLAPDIDGFSYDLSMSFDGIEFGPFQAEAKATKAPAVAKKTKAPAVAKATKAPAVAKAGKASKAPVGGSIPAPE
jgi:hypothetical protein